MLLVLWLHGLGLEPLVEVDIPGVLKVELCISRCEVEWFIAGGNAKGLLATRDVKVLNVISHSTHRQFESANSCDP